MRRATALSLFFGSSGGPLQLRDVEITRGRGWPEAAALLTFSPTSYALEGLASAAPLLAFTDAERIRIVRDELVPLAGLSRVDVEAHVRANRLLARLDGVTASLTRAYLTGAETRSGIEQQLRRHAAMDHPEATLAFIDAYRAYATAYTTGRSLAWQLVGPGQPLELQWQRYTAMVLNGRLGSPGAAPVAPPASRAATN